MSYERKFCGLSEYVRLQNIRPLIKSIDLSKCGRPENSKLVILRLFEANMASDVSYDRKFCRLSEYVWFQKVRLLTKYLDRSKWDPADFGKWALPRYWWNLDYCPQYESCLGQWLSICPQYNFTSLKTVFRLEAKVQKSVPL